MFESSGSLSWGLTVWRNTDHSSFPVSILQIPMRWTLLFAQIVWDYILETYSTHFTAHCEKLATCPGCDPACALWRLGDAPTEPCDPELGDKRAMKVDMCSKLKWIAQWKWVRTVRKHTMGHLRISQNRILGSQILKLTLLCFSQIKNLLSADGLFYSSILSVKSDCLFFLPLNENKDDFDYFGMHKLGQ